MKRIPLPFLGLGVALALGAVALYSAFDRPAAPPSAASSAVPIGGPFRLTGSDGREITDQSFPGKWLLVFFGYTFCPDVCPTTLTHIAAALEALGPMADQIQPLFVTVDPARDTPAVLKDYLGHFDGRIIGLTGSQEAITAAEHAYKVYAAPIPSKDGVELFNHSAYLYLMTPNGQYATHFSADTSGQDMAQGIKQTLEKATNKGES